MNINQITTIVENYQPLFSYGFILKLSEIGESVSNIKFLTLVSNEIHNRETSLRISEIITKDKHFYNLIFRISKTNELGYDENGSIYLEEWLKGKNYKFDADIFCVYPDKGSLEGQFENFFKFIDEVFQIDELNRIIKGEYWEFKTTDWGLFGR